MKKLRQKLNAVIAISGLFSMALPVLTTTAFAGGGDKVGGGGDAHERRVSEIRADILKWIIDGGSKDLILPTD